MSDRTAKLELFCESIAAQPFAFDEAAILSWFEQYAPWVDPLWVQGTMTAATVNDRARRHYPEPPDLLFRQPGGAWERYEPRRHGPWLKTGVAAAEGTVGPEGHVVFVRNEQRNLWRQRRAG